jgi:hypothetical protein
MQLDRNLAGLCHRAGKEAFLEGLLPTANPTDRLPFPHHSRAERAEIRTAWEKGWNSQTSLSAGRLAQWLGHPSRN